MKNVNSVNKAIRKAQGELTSIRLKDINRPKTIEEGINLLKTAAKTNDSSCLLNPMEDGAKEFEKRVGRPMTYGEMRAMWG